MKKYLSYLLLLFVLAIAACAPVGAYHTFYFEPTNNKNVKVLDWKYGDLWAGRRYVKVAESGGQGLGREIAILKPVGDYLYIKWIVLPSPEIHEVNVDLKPLLPWNMADAKVIPIFNKSNELEIYLTVPDQSAPVHWIFMNQTLVKKSAYQLYPVKRKIEPTGEGVKQ